MGAEDTHSSIFPRTDWVELGKSDEANLGRLDRLIRQYWEPLKIHLVTAFPSLKDEADTILVEFAEDKMLKAGWLQRADPNRGRFRDFLKTSLRNFVRDRLSRAEVKRAPISLEELEHEIPQPMEEKFELAWFKTVLDEAIRRMEADCRNPAEDQPRRTQIWEMFRMRLLQPLLDDTPEVPYDRLIERFGLKSPSEAFNTLASGKRIFKMHLVRVIEEYAQQDGSTQAEIDALDGFLPKLLKSK